MPTLPNRVYDVFKWLCVIVLPALAKLIVNVFATWGIPYGPQISDTILDVQIFLGAVLCISQISYTKAKAAIVAGEEKK